MQQQDIESYTCHELVKEACHYLTQKATIAYSFITVLLNEDAYGFANDEQKQALNMLKDEIEAIREINNMLHVWLSAKETDST